MKYLFLIFSFVLIQTFSYSQTIDVFEYVGAPYHHKTPFVYQSIPNLQLDFVFCTINIPDSLIIEFCSDTLVFFIGAGETEHPEQLFGFVEMTYDEGVLTTLQDSADIPLGFENNGMSCWKTGGTMLLHFKLPNSCCSVTWRIIGNKYDHTVYSFRVIKKEDGYWEASDTLVDYSCSEPSSGRFVIDRNNCIAYWQEIINAEIEEEPEIKNPDCDTTGYIHFPLHPDFNLENLSAGNYAITINNSICEKTFTITLRDRKICNIYVPNIFSPHNQDGINDKFNVSNDKGSQYNVWIYDRWGELIHKGTYDNNDGWHGYYKGKLVNPGVYVYKVQLIDDLEENFLVGDVTVI